MAASFLGDVVDYSAKGALVLLMVQAMLGQYSTGFGPGQALLILALLAAARVLVGLGLRRSIGSRAA